MTFQIVRLVATYCPIRGGINGSKAVRLPMSYRNERLAHKLAGRLHQQDYDHGDDDSFVVVPYGESPYKRSLNRAATTSFDEIPF